MNKEELFRQFAENITATFAHHQYAKEQADRELQYLARQRERLCESPELLSEPISLSFNYFLSAIDGKPTTFGKRHLTIDERIKSVLSHKNKIYQWTIAEAYEHFEKFCWRFYCAMGCTHPDFWSEKDYERSDKPADQRTALTYEERLKLITHKRDRTTEILKIMRAKRPEFTRLERNNQLRQDLKLFIVMCEKFRHQIVHAGGFLPEDKDSFVDDCLAKAGISGPKRADHRVHIEKYIGSLEGRAYLKFLDIPHPDLRLRQIGGHFDICSDFLKGIGSYANLMIACSQ
ncbi:hypothetical protein [Pseudomonas putida]|uniref:hypothetical protein n=1 Tax=Pseudomonas putida TaxID=303 RepID=UPI0039DFC047